MKVHFLLYKKRQGRPLIQLLSLLGIPFYVFIYMRKIS